MGANSSKRPLSSSNPNPHPNLNPYPYPYPYPYNHPISSSSSPYSSSSSSSSPSSSSSSSPTTPPHATGTNSLLSLLHSTTVLHLVTPRPIIKAPATMPIAHAMRILADNDIEGIPIVHPLQPPTGPPFVSDIGFVDVRDLVWYFLHHRRELSDPVGAAALRCPLEAPPSTVTAVLDQPVGILVRTYWRGFRSRVDSAAERSAMLVVSDQSTLESCMLLMRRTRVHRLAVVTAAELERLQKSDNSLGRGDNDEHYDDDSSRRLSASHIFSQSDVIRWIAAGLEKNLILNVPFDSTLESLGLGKRSMVTTNEDERLFDALQRIEEHQLTALPVMSHDGKRVVGSLSAARLRHLHPYLTRAEDSEVAQSPSQIYEQLLEGSKEIARLLRGTVGQFITEISAKYRHAVCTETSTVRDVIAMMANCGLHRVFVIDSQSPSGTQSLWGVVSLQDIIEWLHSHAFYSSDLTGSKQR